VSHFSVGGYLSINVATFLLVQVDLLLLLQDLDLVVPDSSLVFLAQGLQLALLGVV